MKAIRPTKLDHSYEEFLRPAGSRVVKCTWRQQIRGDSPVVVVPDGCVDLIWRSDGRLLVAGADTVAKRHEMPDGLALVGVRLRPGTAGTVLGCSMSDLADRFVDVGDCWGLAARRILDALDAAESVTVQRERLIAAVEDRALAAAHGLDLAVMTASAALSSGEHTTQSLPGFGGLASRQFRRRFVGQVGYGPKKFERISRLRRARAMRVSQPWLGLADLAARSGYADQSHLSRDAKDLLGQRPSEWSVTGATTVSYKPRGRGGLTMG